MACHRDAYGTTFSLPQRVLYDVFSRHYFRRPQISLRFRQQCYRMSYFCLRFRQHCYNMSPQELLRAIHSWAVHSFSAPRHTYRKPRPRHGRLLRHRVRLPLPLWLPRLPPGRGRRRWRRRWERRWGCDSLRPQAPAFNPALSAAIMSKEGASGTDRAAVTGTQPTQSTLMSSSCGHDYRPSRHFFLNSRPSYLLRPAIRHTARTTINAKKTITTKVRC